ncbi:hypothetical protein SALBM311S_11463 [Streptomyces alboniger]
MTSPRRRRAVGAGTWETSSRSFPVIQWFGASKWVPVYPPVRKLFQYQAGPRSS